MPVLFILALIGCCCCVKKCCCKKSSSKGNASAPATQHQVSFPSGVFGVFEVRAGVFISIYLLQDRAQPSVTYSVAPATPVNRYQTVRPVAPSQPPAFSTGPSVCFKGVRELYRKTWHTLKAAPFYTFYDGTAFFSISSDDPSTWGFLTFECFDTNTADPASCVPFRWQLPLSRQPQQLDPSSSPISCPRMANPLLSWKDPTSPRHPCLAQTQP